MRAYVLATEHWRYVKCMLEIHGIEDSIIEKAGYYYLVGFMEGYKFPTLEFKHIEHLVYGFVPRGCDSVVCEQVGYNELKFHFTQAFLHGQKHSIEDDED